VGWIFHNTCPSLFSLDDDVSCSLVRVLSLDDDVSCSVVRVLFQLVLLSSHRWILSLPLNGTSTSKDFKRERGKKDFEDWEKRRDRDDWGGLWRNAEAIVRQWADSCVLTRLTKGSSLPQDATTNMPMTSYSIRPTCVLTELKKLHWWAKPSFLFSSLSFLLPSTLCFQHHRAYDIWYKSCWWRNPLPKSLLIPPALGIFPLPSIQVTTQELHASPPHFQISPFHSGNTLKI